MPLLIFALSYWHQSLQYKQTECSFLPQMLDRYEQHTLKCSSCKGAYEAFQMLQKLFIGTTIVFCATAGIPSEFSIRLLLAAAAIASAAVAYALRELQKNFVYVDYIHANID